MSEKKLERKRSCERRIQAKNLDQKERKQMDRMWDKGFVGKREMKKPEREEARERD